MTRDFLVRDLEAIQKSLVVMKRSTGRLSKKVLAGSGVG
jgi:hypothetical protein